MKGKMQFVELLATPPQTWREIGSPACFYGSISLSEAKSQSLKYSIYIRLPSLAAGILHM